MEKGSIIDAREEWLNHSTVGPTKLPLEPNPNIALGVIKPVEPNLNIALGEPVSLPADIEWEMYKEMCAQMEESDPELSIERPRPRHCPIPTDDIYVPSKSYEFPKLPDPEFPY